MKLNNDIPTPPGKTYLPYQQKGIRYALGGRGTLIADEMGLGKTVQAIGVINARKAKHVLIVCPAGLKLNWRKELEAWLVEDFVTASVFVISYHEAGKAEWAKAKWDILIIDEAHYCKNPTSKRTQALTHLASNANYVLALTGTPIENRPVELWPLLQILCPEKWTFPNAGITLAPERKVSHPGEGPNFWAFAKRYCDLKKVSFKVRGQYKTSWDFSGASNLDELRKKLRATCMVRRLKSEVLTELPAKRRQLIVFESKEKAPFDIPDMDETNYEEKLRELKADKVLFEEWARVRHTQALAKVDSCVDFIGDALDESKKLIVFAHHKDVIEKLTIGLQLACENAGGYLVVVTGATPLADRQEAVRKFQEDEQCLLFLGSIGAAGVGFTLTAASHVIFAELDPVPGKMAQAEDRAHRIGQKNMVLVQHLLTDRSLCARMAKILVKKQEVIGRALDGPDSGPELNCF